VELMFRLIVVSKIVQKVYLSCQTRVYPNQPYRKN
jgi:hypothetical protein